MYRETQIAILDSISRHATGTSFVLMMEHKVKGHSSDYSEEGWEDEYYGEKYKDYSYHPRFDQPCQGGETRKYAGFNKDCTQPHNKKPGDLFHPFPDGKPSAISFPLRGLKYADKDNEVFFKAVFSNGSPWFNGFGGSENVRFLKDDKGYVYGVIIGVKNLDVDPTVMINCIQFIRNSQAKDFIKLVEAGFTDNEAMAVLMLNQGSADGSIHSTYDYYFCSVFSAKRFFGKKPNDLSGGYYSARTDYNRTYVQDVFQADPEDNGIVWESAMIAETGIIKENIYSNAKVEFDVFVKAAKAVLTRALEQENPLTNKPYQYRDATGRPIDLSAPKKVKKSNETSISVMPVAKEAA